MTAICDQDCFRCKFPDCILSTMDATAGRRERKKDPRGEILRAGRLAAGYKTATELAEAMGIAPREVKAWEAGKRWPRGRAAAKLYRYLPAVHGPAKKAITREREKKPEVQAAHRRYRQQHPEIYRAASARYAAAHPERRRELMQRYRDRRYAEDINWQVKKARADRLRSRERYAIMGEAIRREREALYGYQKDAVILAGVPQSTWSAYETGTCKPNWSRIEPILPDMRAKAERYVEERRRQNAEF